MSQNELSELAGLHRNQISNIERNASSRERFADPHLSTIYRLASALGVPPPAFLLPDVDRPVVKRSPEQATPAEQSRVEIDLRRVLRELRSRPN